MKWIVTSIISIACAVLAFVYLDHPVAEYCKYEMNYELKEFMKVWTHLALADAYFLILLLFFVSYGVRHSRLNSSSKLKRMLPYAQFALAALLFNGIIINILKFVFGRQRPTLAANYTHDNFTWFNFDWQFHSMPSGHTQVAFTLAMLAFYIFPKWNRPLVFGIAISLGLSRVFTTAHFVSDTLIGALIAILGTKFLYETVFKKRIHP